MMNDDQNDNQSEGVAASRTDALPQPSNEKLYEWEQKLLNGELSEGAEAFEAEALVARFRAADCN
jgi:hypothetical protein